MTNIHESLHKKYGKSYASLRDIERLRRLYKWFEDNCPKSKVSIKDIPGSICRYYFSNQIKSNIDMDFHQRILIVTLCSVYVSKAQS